MKYLMKSKLIPSVCSMQWSSSPVFCPPVVSHLKGLNPIIFSSLFPKILELYIKRATRETEKGHFNYQQTQ